MVAAVVMAPKLPWWGAIQRFDEEVLGAVVSRRPAVLRRPVSVVTELAAPGFVVPVVAGAAASSLRKGLNSTTVGTALGRAAAGIALRRVLADVIR